MPQAYWASVTIAFIFTESAGDAYLTGSERLLGTVVSAWWSWCGAVLLLFLIYDNDLRWSEEGG